MPFLRNAWYAAMWSQDLPAGQIRHRTILGEPLVFYRKADGGVAALADECPHRFAPLHRGQLCGDDRIRCAYHGLEFDASGQCVRNPHGNGFIPPTARVASHPVAEKHTMLWIWMGSDAPDPGAIPDFSVLDADSRWPVGARDCITMKANYQLIADNLMDLSHISFLHDGILGNDQTVDAEMNVTQDGDSVTVTRLASNVRPPGLFDLLFRRDGQPVDFWTSIRWHPPALMLNDSGVKPVGAAKSEGTGILGSHLLTPETESSTHYFFAAARQYPMPFPPDEAESIRQKLDEFRRFAFIEQDTPIIEAQQRALDRTGGMGSRRPTFLSIDAGPARYLRILEARIQAEAGRDG